MGHHEWTQLELGTVYLFRILSAKATGSVWSRTSGYFPGAPITALWNPALVLLFALLTKGSQFVLLLFWVANDSSKLKIFVIHCSHNLPTLFNLLYLSSVWYNFLNKNHRRNKNKALGHVSDSFTVPPASFQLQGHNASGDIASINVHLRCWTLPY